MGLGVPIDYWLDPVARGDADQPWERSGAVRRDCQAHRGQLLLSLADVALLLGALSPCLGFPALIALILGVVAWALSCHDQRRMRAGLMEPAGWSNTATARGRALGGAVLGLFGAIIWVCFLTVIR